MIRNDRKIAIALLLLAVAFAAFFWKFGNYTGEPHQTFADSLYKYQHTKHPVQYYATESKKAERFPFAPPVKSKAPMLAA